jgi:hypothetical protein
LRADLMADLDALSDTDPLLDIRDPRHPSLWVGDSGSVTAGRGLQLLGAVSDTWGVSELLGPPAGKEVWFTLAVPPTWTYTSSCLCRSDSAARTASGTPVRHLDGPWDRA